MLQYTNNDEVLTLQEIKEKYPNGWVGLKNVSYEENGMTIKSAVVVCFDTVCKDIDLLYVRGEVQYRLKTKDSNSVGNLTMLTIPQLME